MAYGLRTVGIGDEMRVCGEKPTTTRLRRGRWRTSAMMYVRSESRRRVRWLDGNTIL
jgi:hypothetical protein